MENIINKQDDFTAIKSANMLKKLLNLMDKRDQEIIENPVKYFNLAADHIVELERLIRTLKDVAYPQINIDIFHDGNKPITYTAPETLTVTKEDYECLCALRQLLKEDSNEQ